MKTALVTGSSGLIGSEAVLHFDRSGYRVVGIDNNMRREFFGEKGDTTPTLEWLRSHTSNFRPHSIDIRDRGALEALFRDTRFDVICHCAAQPSHDLASRLHFEDFDVNAGGTVNLLEMTHRHSPDAVFLHMSTNKVYGDGPNHLDLKETETRYDYAAPEFHHGISESFPIDHCLHSFMGASKVAADIMVQEYGRYYGMKTACFRGGCLTGPRHRGVELHGFLSYLVKATLHGIPYTIYGYKGKQVRDQIHCSDVVAAFDAFIQHPKPGAVYNLGGGRGNAASLIECIRMIEDCSGRTLAHKYDPTNRVGDHICYISDLRRLHAELPGWGITKTLPQIIEEMVKTESDHGK